MEESEQGKVTGGKIRVKRTSDTTAPYRCLGFTQREMGHFQQKSAWFKSIGLAAKLTMDCGEASQKQRLIRRLLQYCRRRQWHPTTVLLPGKSHGRRSLVGCSPWGCWELDMTQWLHFHALEKEMAIHSSVLDWRIPGTAESGGLPSMGSHRVRHNWSNLAAILQDNGGWQQGK